MVGDRQCGGHRLCGAIVRVPDGDTTRLYCFGAYADSRGIGPAFLWAARPFPLGLIAHVLFLVFFLAFSYLRTASQSLFPPLQRLLTLGLGESRPLARQLNRPLVTSMDANLPVCDRGNCDRILNVFPAFATDLTAGARSSCRNATYKSIAICEQSTNGRGFRDVCDTRRAEWQRAGMAAAIRTAL